MNDSEKQPGRVVAIGASAGGLAALQAMLPNLPSGLGLAYVLALHMDPTHPSMLDRILQRSSKLTVKNGADGETLLPDHLYIIPSDQLGTIVDGKFKFEPVDHPHGPRHTIDILFASVARAWGERGVGVVLSGSGSDGLHGVRAIKAAEGIAIIQDPQTAEYDGMPGAILQDRLADIVSPPERIGDELKKALGWGRAAESELESDADVYQAIARTLTRKTGLRFDQYREATLRRRLERRRIISGQESLVGYLELLESSDAETEKLLQDMFISVTEFFRDTEAFSALGNAVNELVAAKKRGESIRVWVPGCATGEEAFSIAMLIAEAVDAADRTLDVQLFATDIDEQAIAAARKSVYLKTAVSDVPKHFLQKYFVAVDGAYRIATSIRDMVSFARHDLLQDPPFSRLDLVSCRNVLIYFKRPTQERLIRTFHYVLDPGAYLLLGPSETVGKLSDLFSPVDRKGKLYRRCAVAGTLPSAGSARKPTASTAATPAVTAGISDIERQVRDLVYQHIAPPSVVVDQHFNLVHSHGDVSAYVRIREGDMSVNLLDMVNSPLRVELRLILQKCERNRRMQRSKPIAWESGGQKMALTLTALPIDDGQGKGGRQLVLFDASPLAEAAIEGRPPDDEDAAFRIRELEQELAATRDHLQTNIEELESSNEELQSVNEEYQATTEELQSANEELQTTNEELQSANEELSTVNEELRIRSDELGRANTDLESILNAAVAGIVVLDSDLRVTRYSSASREVFDLMPASIGRPLIAVGGAVDLALLLKDIQHALATRKLVERQLDLGDRSFLVRFLPQYDGEQNSGLVITFVEVTDTIEKGREVRRLATVLRDSSDAITMQTFAGNIVSWNRGAERMYGYSEAEALSMNFRELIPPGEREAWRTTVEQIATDCKARTFEAMRRHHDGHEVEVSIAIRALVDEGGRPYAIATTERDIAPLREAEAQRRQAEFAYESRLTTAGEMAAGLAHELNQPLTSLMHFCDAAQSIVKGFDRSKANELEEVMADAAKQAKRAGEIVNSLRRFVGRREPERKPGSMNAIIESAISLMRPTCDREGVEIELSLAEALPHVSVDSTQIEQVLVNLIRNSIDAMVEAGSKQRKIEISSRVDKKLETCVQVTVKDSGPGVPAEVLGRLFEPFHTRKADGLGMGLWISRSLVESHGGRLWADKNQRNGAVFHFSIVAEEEER